MERILMTGGATRGISDGHLPRVLLTTDGFGDVWNCALELVRSLNGRFDFVLATQGAGLTPEQRCAAQACVSELYEGPHKPEWMDEPWPEVDAAGEWLLELEARVRPDLIHVNSYSHASLPFCSPVALTAHSCVYPWRQVVDGAPPQPSWKEHHNVVAAGLRAAEQVAVPSQAILDALELNFGPQPHACVIYNGLDSQRFFSVPKEPFIFSAGRPWDEAQNVGTLAGSADKLPWPVCIAGEQISPDGARVDVANVCRVGALEPEVLAGWLARASIFVSPAKYEPFGLSVLSAALSGCALVLGDIPSLREIWGECAVYVTPGDAEKLEKVLLDLISLPRERARLGARAHARAGAYSSSAMGGAYEALYRQLTGAGACA